MDSRAQFEAWCDMSFPFKRDRFYLVFGKYRSQFTRQLWEAWQASRAAIEIELPAYLDATTHGFSAFNDALDLCENEIRKQGISIKEELPLQHEAKEE